MTGIERNDPIDCHASPTALPVIAAKACSVPEPKPGNGRPHPASRPLRRKLGAGERHGQPPTTARVWHSKSSRLIPAGTTKSRRPRVGFFAANPGRVSD
ncbi:hypothetical protein [Vogesella indigofera]|uniref:hypothetical protein n=1 Tax=Vogesella indigofera TaxID=45465 RepID=UPI00234EE4B7|nr:hypothetical protein [Vogesella indigofera]MDC7697062.1 hypothetical protein [Vogesella indigofera]